MKVLLDTQPLLLWTMRGELLSDRVRRLISDPRTELATSAASVWELSIKERSGKLALPTGYFEALIGSDLRFIAITEQDGVEAGRLPLHHRDPFDRMIVAQARREGLPIVGSDAALAAYDVEVIW